MRQEIKLTDEEIIEMFDGRDPDFDSIIFTRDTIENFKTARKGWSDGGKLSRDDLTFYEVYFVQSRKGEPRKNLTVVDFGTVRACYLA